jgi:hypothetical protein
MEKLDKYCAFVVVACSIRVACHIFTSWSLWAFDILLFLLFSILLGLWNCENAFEMQVRWSVQMVSS